MAGRRTAWVWWLLAATALGLAIWREMANHARLPPPVAVVAIPDAPAHVVMPDAPERTTTPDVAPQIPEPDAASTAVDATLAEPVYTITEALADVHAGPLVFIGTGPWFGNASIPACAYRNERVIVVNNYCTATETPAFELIVLSPSRGRLAVYAEAETAISTLGRAAYGSFKVEAEPPVRERVALDFRYAALRAWDERRYNARSSACYTSIGEPAACSEELGDPHAWGTDSEPFLANPPDAWYQLVKDLHARAVRDSRAAKQ